VYYGDFPVILKPPDTDKQRLPASFISLYPAGNKKAGLAYENRLSRDCIKTTVWTIRRKI
jgi:hypothetical protein